jgi:hypothetical protein
MKFYVFALSLIALGSVAHAVSLQDAANQAAGLVSQAFDTQLPISKIQEAFTSFRVSSDYKITIKIRNSICHYRLKSGQVVQWVAEQLMNNVFKQQGYNGQFYLRNVKVERSEPQKNGDIDFRGTVDMAIKNNGALTVRSKLSCFIISKVSFLINRLNQKYKRCQVSVSDKILSNSRLFKDDPVCVDIQA